jgi:hypothetical protein
MAAEPVNHPPPFSPLANYRWSLVTAVNDAVCRFRANLWFAGLLADLFARFSANHAAAGDLPGHRGLEKV